MIEIIENDRENYTVIKIGGITLCFSYKTIVGYIENSNPRRANVVLENFSRTTAKHINQFIGDKVAVSYPHSKLMENIENLMHCCAC